MTVSPLSTLMLLALFLRSMKVIFVIGFSSFENRNDDRARNGFGRAQGVLRGVQNFRIFFGTVQPADETRHQAGGLSAMIVWRERVSVASGACRLRDRCHRFGHGGRTRRIDDVFRR